jgi:hypothetical protein
MKLTRRNLAALAAAAVAAPARTQAQQPAAGEDLIKLKRDQMHNNAEALAKVKIPMATEPAVQFKA